MIREGWDMCGLEAWEALPVWEALSEPGGRPQAPWPCGEAGTAGSLSAVEQLDAERVAKGLRP